MTTLSDLEFSDYHIKILNSLMAGGQQWERYTKEGGTCLKSCPFYSLCRGSGPSKVCSKNWQNAEATHEAIDVALHVIKNFDYYNRGDVVADSNEIHKLENFLRNIESNQVDEEFSEGLPVLRNHRIRERNSKSVRQKKSEALAEGCLVCEACGVDYLALYGTKALRLIECHHTIPLSSVEHSGKTRKADLLLLCANCHRLAHSEPTPLPLEKLQELVRPSHL